MTATATVKRQALTAAEKAAAKEAKAREAAKAKAEKDARLATLKAAWDGAETREAKALNIFAEARKQVGVSKVYKARVAVLVGIELASARYTKGAPNLGGAADYLGVAKSTFRPYFDGGLALMAEGMHTETGIPTDAEIKVANDAIRESMKKEKAGETIAPAETSKAPAEDSTGGEAKAEADALTVADLLGHVGRINATLELMRKTSAVLTEREAEQVAEMLGEAAMQIRAYAEGK